MGSRCRVPLAPPLLRVLAGRGGLSSQGPASAPRLTSPWLLAPTLPTFSRPPGGCTSWPLDASVEALRAPPTQLLEVERHSVGCLRPAPRLVPGPLPSTASPHSDLPSPSPPDRPTPGPGYLGMRPLPFPPAPHAIPAPLLGRPRPGPFQSSLNPAPRFHCRSLQPSLQPEHNEQRQSDQPASWTSSGPALFSGQDGSRTHGRFQLPSKNGKQGTKARSGLRAKHFVRGE